jgi:lysophospholipase
MAELRRDEGSFPTADQLKLFWVSTIPEAPRAHLALVHGYAEHIGRYAHVMDHFAGLGYAVHGFDVRGHGRSEGPRAHVRSFSDYIDDLGRYLERVKIAAGGKKVFLLGHSHGGLIGATHALSQPRDLAGLVLTSPFFGLAFKPPAIKVMGAKLLGSILPGLNMGNEIKSESLTRDQAMVAAHRADTLNVSTTTPGWFNAAMAAQARVLAEAGKVTLPLGMFVGGNDPIADAKVAKLFFDRAGSADKSFKAYDGALHEVLNETNRAEVFSDIAAWMDQRI